MKKISKIKIIFTILGVAVFSSVFLFGNTAKADDVLTVQFERDPLFYETNLVPGDTKTGWIKVTNNSSTTAQEILIKSDSVYECTETYCLSDMLNMVISEGGSPPLYSESLTKFFEDSENGLLLSLLGPGDTTQYDISVYFNESAENEYQAKTTNFDLIIGLEITGRVAGVATAPSEETIPQTLGRILGAAITKTGGSIVFVLLLSFLIASTCYLIYLKARSKKNKENCDI